MSRRGNEREADESAQREGEEAGGWGLDGRDLRERIRDRDAEVAGTRRLEEAWSS